ncbi:hypothetical protein AM2_1929 [Lactococcus cremoris]|nr:hypothetical protein SK110_2076 [Lactococcus cremoris]KZK52849.1 hypothetical protein AM2_1929 [Lactococcus cremoris]
MKLSSKANLKKIFVGHEPRGRKKYAKSKDETDSFQAF